MQCTCQGQNFCITGFICISLIYAKLKCSDCTTFCNTRYPLLWLTHHHEVTSQEVQMLPEHCFVQAGGYCVLWHSQWVVVHGGAKQAACVVTFVIIIKKGYKLGLHRAVNTSQSSQGVIWMYCIINKQSVTNFRSTVLGTNYHVQVLRSMTPHHTTCWTLWIIWYYKTNYLLHKAIQQLFKSQHNWTRVSVHCTWSVQKVSDLNFSRINKSSTGSVHHCRCGGDIYARAWIFSRL